MFPHQMCTVSRMTRAPRMKTRMARTAIQAVAAEDPEDDDPRPA